MNLKNGEREPSDEDDEIPERQYDFNLIAMDESNESLHVNDENMALESSASDSETVYSPSLSGVPHPSPALARRSSSNLTVEEEAGPDTIRDSASTTETQISVSSESESRTQPVHGNSTPMNFTNSVPASPTISASGVEIVRELMDDVLRSFISNSDSDTIENQEAEADVASPGVLAASIRMNLEDLVPLENCQYSQTSEEDVAGSEKALNVVIEQREPQNPSLDPFPSSASTLILSPETIPAGSGLSSGLVFSPEREPPVPIARSSPVINNLKSRASAEETQPEQGEDEISSSMSQDDLDEESEAESENSGDGDCFSGVMKGIEQLQPKTSQQEKEALNVSQDMFASQSQSQGDVTTQQSHPNLEIEIETESKEVEALMSNNCDYSTAALTNFAMALSTYKATNVSQNDISGQSQKLSTTSRAVLVRPGPVTVPNNHQATPGTVTGLADKLPVVGAKRPRQDFDHDNVEENHQAPEKAKRKLDFRQKRKRTSKSKRAGLVFPVSRINSRIKEGKFAKRSGVTAGVYMAGVLEYLVAEVAELAGQIAKHKRKHRITPRHIQLAILSDEEINTLTKGIIIPQGGVIPWIHPTLIGLKKKIPQDCQGKFYKDLGNKSGPV